jgi:5-methyltetrahydropteroyltriglutamate--homocysteine methyltransferase
LQHFAIGHDGLPKLSIETPQEVADTLRATLDHVRPERLYPFMNCGMAPMAAEIACAKLPALAAGAELARKAV